MKCNLSKPDISCLSHLNSEIQDMNEIHEVPLCGIWFVIIRISNIITNSLNCWAKGEPWFLEIKSSLGMTLLKLDLRAKTELEENKLNWILKTRDYFFSKALEMYRYPEYWISVLFYFKLHGGRSVPLRTKRESRYSYCFFFFSLFSSPSSSSSSTLIKHFLHFEQNWTVLHVIFQGNVTLTNSNVYFTRNGFVLSVKV